MQSTKIEHRRARFHAYFLDFFQQLPHLGSAIIGQKIEEETSFVGVFDIL